jgi:hypothetical protein
MFAPLFLQLPEIQTTPSSEHTRPALVQPNFLAQKFDSKRYDKFTPRKIVCRRTYPETGFNVIHKAGEMHCDFETTPTRIQLTKIRSYIQTLKEFDSDIIVLPSGVRINLKNREHQLEDNTKYEIQKTLGNLLDSN